MKNLRKVEIWEEGEWKEGKFRELKVDDQFRLFEDDGAPVNKGAIFKATSIPFLNSEGVYAIRVNGGKYEKSGG